jgi:hypothetical protein
MTRCRPRALEPARRQPAAAEDSRTRPRVTEPGGGSPVQRYQRVPAARQKDGRWQAGVALRVADDGRMAVPEGETHRMFAAADVIAEAAEVMRAAGSMFTLGTGQGSLSGPVPEDPSRTSTLHEVVPRNLVRQSAGDAMTTDENCSTLGQEIMGAGIRQGPHPYSHGLAAQVGGQWHKWDRIQAGDNAIKSAVRDRMTGLGPQPREASEEAYAKLSNRQRDQQARLLGVNQHADPQPGQALAVYAAVERLKRGYPMHFAAVIARSGRDYVTLENYAKEGGGSGVVREAQDTVKDSHAWYFRMYGPPKRFDDQSFYGEQVRKGEQGGRRGTMVLLHAKVGGPATDLIVRAQRTWSIWEPYAVSVMDRDRTPLFKARYERFRKVFLKLKSDAMTLWLQDKALPAARYDELTQALDECAATEVGSALLQNPDIAAAPREEEAVRAERQRVHDAALEALRRPQRSPGE